MFSFFEGKEFVTCIEGKETNPWEKCTQKG